ncbi:MAG TPA: RNA-binding cell elongation regulator Jag/EloR [Ktedonobacterales bacterium]
MESVEASGKSIEDAILQALARLGRNRNEVDIQVLQEPSRGNRGMGVREARVRVYVKPARTGGPPRPAAAPGMLAGDGTGDLYEEGYGDEGYAEEGYGEAYPEEALLPEVAPELLVTPLHAVLEEDASIEEFAVVALQTILALMGMPAEIEVAEPNSPETEEEEPLTLNIRASDDQILSLLIGRRGETLSALQLLVNLIVAKQTGHHERIHIDAEGYRARREDNLRAMAQRVAAQVRRSGAPIMLEAMPPNERRIIHMELAESPDVSTESTGEGEARRVVISPSRGPRAPRDDPSASAAAEGPAATSESAGE